MMSSHVLYLVIASVACIVAAAPAENITPEKVNNEPKPKREAPLPSGGGYHGPSYKYLPPSSSAPSGGYDSYRSGQHDSYADVGGYDFSENAAGHDIGHFFSKTPKVETFIIKTQPLHSSHGAEHSGLGYRYAAPSNSFSGEYHQKHQSGHGNSYAHHSHGSAHKVKSIPIPVRGYSAPSHGDTGYSRFGGSSEGVGYSKGSAGGSHYLNAGSSNSIGGGYGGNSFATKHVGYSGGSHSGGHGLHSASHASSVPVHSVETTHGGADYASVSHRGYSFDIPDPTHSHGSQGVPSDSYGVPINNASPEYHVSESTPENIQPPSYASGHKGLGHFGFVATRPQPLHTNYISSNKYENSYSNHGGHAVSHFAEKAPFKPSLFLGSSHENSISGGGGLSTEYGAPAPSNQYLPPPTSDGYDYPPPSTLYGTPSHGHSNVEHTGPAHEQEPIYPPQSSYLPPTAPGDSYLPPHH